MVELILLGLYVLPSGLWLLLQWIQVGVGRDPMAFSVIEMFAISVITGLLVWCLYILHTYRSPLKLRNTFLISYGILIFIGSVLTASMVTSHLDFSDKASESLFYALGFFVFFVIPAVGIFRVCNRLKSVQK